VSALERETPFRQISCRSGPEKSGFSEYAVARLRINKGGGGQGPGGGGNKGRTLGVHAHRRIRDASFMALEAKSQTFSRHSPSGPRQKASQTIDSAAVYSQYAGDRGCPKSSWLRKHTLTAPLNRALQTNRSPDSCRNRIGITVLGKLFLRTWEKALCTKL